MKSFKKLIIFAFIVFLTALSTNSIYSQEYNKTLNKIVQKYPDTKIETNNKKQFLIKNGKKFSGYITLENEKLFFSNGELANWWYDDGNDWFYFKDGKKFTGLASDANGQRYFIRGKYARGYFNGDFYVNGELANWWYDDGNDWFFFKDGKKLSGYGNDKNGRKYFINGKYANGIFFNQLFKNGSASKGFTYVNGIFYAEGTSPANWWYDDGNDWFYFKDGKKFTGLASDANGQRYFIRGKYARGYFNGDFYVNGELANWWYDDGNDWFFFKKGKKLNGYGTDKNGRKYFINGKYANGIFFNQLFKDGSISKGFTYVNGIFYAEGTSPANWWYDDGNDWFYFKDGKKFTGLASDANGQRYFVRGKYANGLYSNKLYKNGLETHGKQYINGRYYAEDKSLAQGWYDDGNDWFFFKNGKKLNGYGTDGNGRKYFVNGKYANGKYSGNYYKNGEYVQKIYGDWYLKDNAFHSLDGNWYVTGNDFVIVSISRQKLWLVRNGEILDEMGVITGNYNLYGPTPKGVYRIQGKVSPTVLKGADYASWVQYWVPFIGNTYGIHDANWQPYYAFSNPNYFRYGGSRGCINVRPDKMGYIYRNVYTGMKVIIY